MKINTLPFILSFVLGASTYAYTATADCAVNAAQWSSSFNKVYQIDEFYIYYSDQPNSPHELKDRKDLNDNNVPDYIENIGIQAQATRDAFHLAGFRHPFNSPRYKNARAIAIFVQTLSGNGLAYENSVKHTHIPAIKKMPCSLSITISNNLPNYPANYWTTVTHELFHLYQYSYNQFKSKWYLESMANWSERALRVDINEQTLKLEALPQDLWQLQTQIFNKNYNAMWRRLFYLHKKDMLKIPQSLMTRKYIDGSAIFKDDVWYGTAFALKFLQDLEKASDAITKYRKWPAYNWRESDQKRTEWNCTIFEIYQKNLQTIPTDIQEIKFLTKISRRKLQPLCQ